MTPRRLSPLALLALAVAVAPGIAHAAPAKDSVGSDDLLGRPIVLVVALALVSLIPFIFMSVTAFVKISTVLQIVRSAIGAQNVPSNTVIMALAASLTLLAMAPVGDTIWARAAPLFEGKDVPDTVTLVKGGIDAVKEPMREFLHANASPTERARFLQVAKESRKEADRDKVTDNDFSILVPAFVVTELTEAFALGFLLYLPFLVIDLVVANVLLSLGMQMLSPTQVSLPFKLLLFVAIDGWGLLARALVAGYQ
jgi:type III secretion protein R